MRKTSIGLVLALSWLVFIGEHARAQVIDPASSAILRLSQAAGPGSALPSHFEMVVWNIQKAGNSEMPVDFARLAKNATLALFQEAIDTPSWVDRLLEAKPGFGWNLAQTFRSDWLGYSTGVATGAAVAPLYLRAALSQVHEPVSMTPKSILITQYALVDRPETLLVANVHAINFREQGAFETHINQLVEMVRAHRGPMIVAGDFNTWIASRQDFLTSSLSALGLTEVPLSRTGFLVLDHVFIRGLSARETESHFDVQTSDHYPITVDVVIP